MLAEAIQANAEAHAEVHAAFASSCASGVRLARKGRKVGSGQ